MSKTVAALVVMILAGSSVRGDDKPLEGDLLKIQGKWMTNAGPASTPIYFTFTKSEMTITVVSPMGDETKLTGEFALDEKTSPKHFDFLNMKNGKDALPKRLGVYAFDGDDKLKIAGGPDEKTRPSEMTEKTSETQGKGNTLVFTRVKEEKK